MGFTINAVKICKQCNQHHKKETCGDHYDPNNRTSQDSIIGMKMRDNKTDTKIWDENTIYGIGERVTLDDKIYLAKIITKRRPCEGSHAWSRYHLPYVDGAFYNKDDEVQFHFSIMKSTKDNNDKSPTNPPSDSEYWILVNKHPAAKVYVHNVEESPSKRQRTEQMDAY